MADYTPDFLIDLTDHFEGLKVEVKICQTEEEFHSIEDYIYECNPDLIRWNPPIKTTALHAGTNIINGKIPNPTGYLLFKNNFSLGTMVHEVFHAARHYFNLTGQDINHNNDETFANLFQSMVEEFNSSFAKCQKSLLGQPPNTAEPHRKASSSKIEANND